MTRAAALALSLALLAACGPRPALRPGEDFSARPEKQVFLALKAAQARDEQRAAILAAYDESQPRLRTLGDEAEALQEQWRSLDPRGTVFRQQAEALASRFGEVSRERMVLTASFDGRVAAALDEEQWEAWQGFWNRPGFERGEGGPPEGGMGGGRRRR